MPAPKSEPSNRTTGRPAHLQEELHAPPRLSIRGQRKAIILCEVRKDAAHAPHIRGSGQLLMTLPGSLLQLLAEPACL